MACIRSNAGFYAVAGGCTFKPGIYPWFCGQAATNWIQCYPFLWTKPHSAGSDKGGSLEKTTWLFQGFLSRKMDRVGVMVNVMQLRVAICDLGQVWQ